MQYSCWVDRVVLCILTSLFLDKPKIWYNNHVQNLPSVGQHRDVNHNLHFVDPATSVHIQYAEFYWNQVKTKFK